MAKAIKKYFIWIALILLLMAGTTIYFASQMSFGPSDQILPGVYLQGVNFSGMKADQAKSAIQRIQTNFEKPIHIQYKDLRWTLPMNRVGIKLNAEGEISRAMAIGRTGSLWQRFQERRQAYRGIKLTPGITLDQTALEELVAEATEVIVMPPRDAGLIINSDNTVEISPGHSGHLVDIDQLTVDIKQHLLKEDQSPIALSLLEVPPRRSTEEVKEMGVNTLLGTFSTQFDPNKVNRAYNVSVAAAALDGLTVSPQEVVSFNEVVGPRSTEAGYKDAPIIINNELVDGLGGGVCQVSTTLYNAVLLANLEVIERTNHSMPISYVPIGRDATVVFDSIDFKFKNNTDYWLYIQSYVVKGRLIIKIFGNSSFNSDVVIRSWVDETYKPETIVEDDYGIRMGDRVVKQKGFQGYKSSAERIIMKEGKVIKVEKLPSSIYKAKNQIISQGMAHPGTILKTDNSTESTIEQEETVDNEIQE